MINPNGSNIAHARVVIQTVLDGGNAEAVRADLIYALSLMHRARPKGGRAPSTHRGWSDPNLKQDILACLAAHPDWTRQKVSIHCNTNTARVSEVMHGLV